MQITKKLLALVCALALVLSLTACAQTEPDTPDMPDTPDASDTVDTPVTPETPDDPYDPAQAVTLTFSDDGIEGTGEGWEAEGTALTIRESGTYLLTGSCADGSVKVKKGTKDVTLVLSDLSLTSSTTAPIVCAKSTGVTIVAAAGTENTLSDTEQNNDDNYPENEDAENAVLKCKDGSQVVLCGSGTLNILASGKNGIKSGMTTDDEGEASLTIRDLTLNISATVNDAVNAEELLLVESGTLVIDAADDALHCDRVLIVGAEGTVGPDITITGCYEGIEGAELSIRSGNVTMHATDDCLNAANSDLPDYDFFIDISGGTLVMDTTSGDGLDSNGTLTISGGTVVVWTANTADNQPLDADGLITISGGTVLAAGGSAGMGMQLSAEQPCVSFGSTSGMPGGGFGGFNGFGGGQRPDEQKDGERPELPDGQQPGENMPELPDGQQPGENAPELPDGQQPGENAPELPDGQQPGENMPELPDGFDFGSFGGFGGSTILSDGTDFTIADESGAVVYSGTALCNAAYVFFSSPSLSADASYTLSAQTALTADAQSGSIGGGFGGFNRR